MCPLSPRVSLPSHSSSCAYSGCSCSLLPCFHCCCVWLLLLPSSLLPAVSLLLFYVYLLFLLLAPLARYSYLLSLSPPPVQRVPRCLRITLRTSQRPWTCPTRQTCRLLLRRPGGDPMRKQPHRRGQFMRVSHLRAFAASIGRPHSASMPPIASVAWARPKCGSIGCAEDSLCLSTTVGPSQRVSP